MKNKILIPVAIVVILAAGWLGWRRSAGPTMNLRPSSAVGEVLAEEVGGLLGGAGKVVVIGRSVAKDGQSASGEQIASFAAAMGRRASPKIAATEWLPPAPPGVMDLGGVSAEQLVQHMEKHPDANAFVIFAGLPPFASTLAQKASSRSLKLIAVCGYSANVRRWLEAKALAVAVVPRLSDSGPETSAPKTAKEWFGREFELITPDKVGGLPY